MGLSVITSKAVGTVLVPDANKTVHLPQKQIASQNTNDYASIMQHSVNLSPYQQRIADIVNETYQ